MRLLFFASLAVTAPVAAQAPNALTAEDYARAESTLGTKLNVLVFLATIRPTWLDGNRFWYRNTTLNEFKFVLVDPAKKTRIVSAIPPADTTPAARTVGLSPDGNKSDRPVVLWSPDSRRIATFQHDARGTIYLVNTAVGQPTLEAWKYPLPGDSVIFRTGRVIIDLATGAIGSATSPT